jgi:hypothetical protein
MPYQLSRRQLLICTGAGIVALRPLAAGNSEFWEKKPPSEWTNEEIDRLITKSPWAKEVNAQYAPGQSNSGGYPTNGGGYPSGGGYPGGGGNRGPMGGGPSIGIPGLGGIGFPRGGNRRGQGGGGQGSAFHGTVRWESALPIRDALKSPLPDTFDGHYVLAVAGIPLLDNRDPDSRDTDTADDSLDNLKAMTSLQVKGKDYVQAGIVKRQVGTGNVLLFGFSKEMLPISKQDGEINFSAQMRRLIVKARFTPKEMLYHGELAV